MISKSDPAPGNFFSTYRGLLGLAKSVKKDLLLYFVAMIFFGITSLSNVGMAELVHRIEDAYNSPDSFWRVYIPLGIIGVAVLRSFGLILGGITASYISVSVSYRLSVRMYKHLMWLPRHFYDKKSVGEVITKLNYNVTLVSEALNSGIAVLLRDGMSLIFLLIYLVYFNWALTLIILFTVPVLLMFMHIFKGRLQTLAERLQGLAILLSRRMVEAFGALSLIKASAAEEFEYQKFKELSSRNKKQSLKMVAVSTSVSPLLAIIVAIAFAGVIWAALRFEPVGFSSIGELMAYITAIFLLGPHIRNLSGVQGRIMSGEVAARDYLQHLQLEYEPNKGRHRITAAEQKQDINIRDLSFYYRKKEPVFKNLNLKIIGGAKNALVGRSGGGKSTIVSLLFRFYLPQQGNITMGDRDLQELELYAWRSGIAYVSQDVFLFNDTLRYNLVYGLKNAKKITDKAIKLALRRAQAWEFVEKMPGQLDAVVGERGVLLSGGEKQRIALARAFIRNSPILILDEATSSLDTNTETKVQKALAEIMRGRTVLVIAHRLSTVRQMDNIIVLEKGRVVEQGTHKQLIKKKGAYSVLYNHQFSD